MSTKTNQKFGQSINNGRHLILGSQHFLFSAMDPQCTICYLMRVQRKIKRDIRHKLNSRKDLEQEMLNRQTVHELDQSALKHHLDRHDDIRAKIKLASQKFEAKTDAKTKTNLDVVVDELSKWAQSCPAVTDSILSESKEAIHRMQRQTLVLDAKILQLQEHHDQVQDEISKIAEIMEKARAEENAKTKAKSDHQLKLASLCLEDSGPFCAISF